MNETEIQERIRELDRKLDLVLESIAEQNRKREEFDDLLADAGIVAKDAFHNTVVMLDKAQVDLDHSTIPILLIKLLQNIDTLHELLDTLESARDFMRDLSPILHQAGLDAVHRMNEFEQKGYFQILRNFTSDNTMENIARFSQALATARVEPAEGNISLLRVIRQLSTPEAKRSVAFFARFLQEFSQTVPSPRHTVTP